MDNRRWWKIVRQVTNEKAQSSIGALIENKVPVTDPSQKTEIFNEYFSNQCKLPPGSNDHPLPDLIYETTERLSDLHFEASDVYKVLISLNVNKATGPDNVSNFILKNAALCTPLSILFNHSLHLGVFPSSWKLSHVIPIHKKNDVNDKSNYRPVSLLSNISKVFEKLIYHKVYYYLTENKLLNPNNSIS